MTDPAREIADEAKAYYPDFCCSDAPLRMAEAPLADCECRICEWLRENAKDMAKRG